MASDSPPGEDKKVINTPKPIRFYNYYTFRVVFVLSILLLIYKCYN
jgi:hypothetical protein